MAFATYFRDSLPPAVADEFDLLNASLQNFFTKNVASDGFLIQPTPGVNLVPLGGILPFAGATAPTGWLLCDGTAVSRVTYKDLFAVVGVTYGVGDGSTTFALPDLRQRFPLGKAASGTGATLGEHGGSIDHTHAVPGLSVPGLTVPGLSVPALSIPTRSVSGSTGTGTSGDESAHVHGIGVVPVIAVPTGVEQVGSSTGDVGLETQNGNATGPGSGHSHSVPSLSVSGTAASGSTGTGTTSAGTTSASTTGTGTSGSTNPPYCALNYIILATA
jgi:microcystin-dependent protein